MSKYTFPIDSSRSLAEETIIRNPKNVSELLIWFHSSHSTIKLNRSTNTIYFSGKMVYFITDIDDAGLEELKFWYATPYEIRYTFLDPSILSIIMVPNIVEFYKFLARSD